MFLVLQSTDNPVEIRPEFIPENIFATFRYLLLSLNCLVISGRFYPINASRQKTSDVFLPEVALAVKHEHYFRHYIDIIYIYRHYI